MLNRILPLLAIILLLNPACEQENLYEYSKKKNSVENLTVTYNGNGNTSGALPVDGALYKTGESVTVLGNSGNLKKTGYIFAGWTTGPGGTGAVLIPGQVLSIGYDNVIFYARWLYMTVAIAPSSLFMIPGTAKQLTATAYYSDGTTADITSSGIWTCTNPASMVVSNTVGSKGLASVVSAGTGVIQVSFTDADGNIHNASAAFTVVNEIFVSQSGNDTTGNGSPESPYATIGKGITEAIARGCSSVNVAAGTYNEVVTMENGRSLYVGWSPDFTVRDINLYLSYIVWTGPVQDQIVIVNSIVTTATKIDGFIINPGNGPNYQHGIYINGGGVTITNNNISAGSGSINNAAICTVGSTGVVVENNIIYGGGGPYSTGIMAAGSFQGPIQNNVIIAGNGSIESKGIWLKAGIAGSVTIRNNTINGGSGSSAYALFADGGSPLVQNNIIFTATGSGFGYYETVPSGAPTKFMNNNIYACSIFYRDNISTTYVTIPTIETYLNGLIPASASGNLNIDLTGSYVNAGSFDYHLLITSPSAVKFGGLDGGPGAQNWGFTKDRDGSTRTGDGVSNWSIGAFEQDL